MFVIEPKKSRKRTIEKKKEIDLIPVITALYLLGMALIWLLMKS
jgi:hypothetical protein